MVNAAGPLSGTRVLDLTRFVSGSYASLVLACLGAEVVKLEIPPTGDPYRSQGASDVGGESALFLSLNSSKSSVALDFRAPRCAEVVERLLASTDFVVENARPGSLEKYQLDGSSVLERHAHIVYGSISGYGPVGPEVARGGFDLTLQAESGMMSVTGDEQSGPVKVGAPVLDVGAGISCALAMLAAHIERSRTGYGAHVSSSLLEFALAGLGTLAADYWASGEVPGLLGTHSPTFAPYGAFHASDGYVVLAGAGTEHLWHKLCETLGRPQLAADPRYATNADRVANREALTKDLESELARRTVDEWVGALDEAGVPAARIESLDAVLTSAQVSALGIVRALHHENAGEYRVIGCPMRIDGEVVAPNAPAEPLGRHTDELLTELGVSESEMEELAAEGFVEASP